MRVRKPLFHLFPGQGCRAETEHVAAACHSGPITGQKRPIMMRLSAFHVHFGGQLLQLFILPQRRHGQLVGFGLLEWALQETGKSPVTEQFYLSGVTFFTLGCGDIVPYTALARTVLVIEAGCGIGFIAVVIGSLPVLYQLFSRREAHVIQLDAAPDRRRRQRRC
jgi:Ion channel